MSAHIVVEIEVENPEDLAAYQAIARETMKEFEIELVGSSANVDLLEGNGKPKRMVLLRAKDAESARRWYASPKYLQAVKQREGIATFRTLLLQ